MSVALCRSRRAQAAIEFTVALGAIVILFMGMVKVWAWMVNNIVARQVKYEQTRQEAGQHQVGEDPTNMRESAGGPMDPVTGKPNYFQPTCLSIFGEDTSVNCSQDTSKNCPP